MSSFENLISRFRKVKEMIAELSDILVSLKGEAESMQGLILMELSAAPERYNVCTRKNLSMGLVGRNVFTVAFGSSVERIVTKPKSQDSEQEWLQDLYNSDFGEDYVGKRYLLLKDKIKADLRSGELTEKGLSKMGLTLQPTANISVRRIPGDTELKALIEEAGTLADSIEAD